MCTQSCSGGVQYSLKRVHAHSIMFKGCSILTQRHSHAINHIQGVFNTHSKAFVRTQSHSGGVQYSLKGVHMHSIRFRRLSHSLKGIHMHSIAFKGCSIHSHSCYVRSKNNRSIKEFGNSLNFLHQLPHGINSTLCKHNFHVA